MSRVSTETCRPRVAAFLVAAAVPMLLSWGCWRGARPMEPGDVPPEFRTSTTERSDSGVTPQAPAAPEGPPGAAAADAGTEAEGRPEAPAAVPAAPPGTAGGQAESTPPPAPSAPESGPSVESPPAEATDGGEAAPAAPTHGTAAEDATTPRREGSDKALRGGAPATGAPGRVTVARLPEALTFDQNGPYWARGREELVYRIEFLGITMGYARFAFNGKVLLGGREAYHLSVRAWTSSVLAIIYPINDTIEYYMDTKTIEPLRQEYTSRGRKKDDVATYDQHTGRIVYRNRDSGEIRKQVDAVPNVYDPVTLAYFFRSREPGGDEKGRNVYAGRKVWEISAMPLGVEKIVTDGREVETDVIRPVIKRNGRIENKGDLRMWMTRDARKVPVRIYAKFKKIRTWTLVGELMPERKGGTGHGRGAS